MKTYATKQSEITRSWRVVDADGATLGRLATEVAAILRGKHKTMFSPHLDTGDPVIVVNAAKVRVTGNKLKAKNYVRHSGYPGGLRSETLEQLLARRPARGAWHAPTEPPRRADVAQAARVRGRRPSARRAKT